MEDLIQLFMQIQELAGVGIEALEAALGGGGGEAPVEGGAPAEGGDQAPPPEEELPPGA